MKNSDWPGLGHVLVTVFIAKVMRYMIGLACVHTQEGHTDITLKELLKTARAVSCFFRPYGTQFKQLAKILSLIH